MKGHNIIYERQRAKCVVIQYAATLCEFIDVIMSFNSACGIYSMDGQIYQVQFVEPDFFSSRFASPYIKFGALLHMYTLWFAMLINAELLQKRIL